MKKTSWEEWNKSMKNYKIRCCTVCRLPLANKWYVGGSPDATISGMYGCCRKCNKPVQKM